MTATGCALRRRTCKFSITFIQPGNDCIATDYSDSNPGSYFDANPGSHSDANPGSDSDANPGNHSDGNAGSHSDANPGSHSDTGHGNRSGTFAEFFSVGCGIRDPPYVEQSICQRIFAEL